VVLQHHVVDLTAHADVGRRPIARSTANCAQVGEVVSGFACVEPAVRRLSQAQSARLTRVGGAVLARITSFTGMSVRESVSSTPS